MESNYWLRRHRLSRRGFVGGTAVAGAGAAAFALVGCGDDDEDDPTTTATATGATGTAAATGTATATGTAAGGKVQGGSVRQTSANNTWDTFDADRSRFTPYAVVLGLTSHGVVEWESFTDAKLRGGFAESWEQPDDNTFVFKVREGLTWHDKNPVNGRAANAQDVVSFIERNKAGLTLEGAEDLNFYRKTSFEPVASAEAVDSDTVKVTLGSPAPLFLNLLAQPFTKVQAREAVEAFEKEFQNFSSDLVIGTNAYTLDTFTADGELTFNRNPGWKGEAWLDGLQYVPLFTDAAAQQAAFEQKQLDIFSPTAKDVLDDILKRYEGKIYERAIFSSNPMAGTYYGGAAPWNDPRLVGAFFLTIDRRALVAQLFQGRGVISGNIPPTQAAFGITERDLVQMPGYREDRAKDLAEAKAMWEAAEGPGLGEVIMDIPDIWEGVYSGVSGILKTQFENNLTGVTVTPTIQTYATITSKIVEQKYGSGANNIWYGWISELTDVEPTGDFIQRYNSKTQGWQQFGVKVDEVDSLTDKLQVEFDIETRKSLLKEAVPIVIENFGMGIPYNMVNINNVLYWNYMKVGEGVPFVTSHNWHTQWSMDRNDPTFEGRRA